MSWLNANEYVLMEATARDRVEDLRATVDVRIVRPETCEKARCDERPHLFRPRSLAPCVPG